MMDGFLSTVDLESQLRRNFGHAYRRGATRGDWFYLQRQLRAAPWADAHLPPPWWLPRSQFFVVVVDDPA